MNRQYYYLTSSEFIDLKSIVIGCIALLISCSSYAASSPYPKSPVIKSITYNWSGRKILANGSDNWPVTWAADGHQYTAWGDGEGFGNTRESLGVAQIAGAWNNFTARNIWAGHGKSYGLLAIFGHKMYMWVRQASQAGKSGQAWVISNKWSSSNGRDFTVIYTQGDSLGSVRARFNLNKSSSIQPK